MSDEQTLQVMRSNDKNASHNFLDIITAKYWWCYQAMHFLVRIKVLEFHNFIIQTLGLSSNILVLKIYEYVEVQKN